MDVLRDDEEALEALIRSATFFEQITLLKAVSSSGVRLGGGPSPHSAALSALPLTALRESLIEALIRTFSGSSVERIRHQEETYKLHAPPIGLPERRMLYLLEQSAEWRPSEEWLRSTIVELGSNWLDGHGSRTFALKLMKAIRAGSLLIDLQSFLLEILESWLESDIAETYQWVLYLEFLDVFRGETYPSRLAETFEEFGEEELSRWHPSPPDLDDLIRIARAFDLEWLEESLLEKEREDELREEAAGNSAGAGDIPQMTNVGSSDESIEQIFERFATP